MGIEIVPKPTKMSFRIEDLAKSSRQESNSQWGDALVYNDNFGLSMSNISKVENTPVKCKTMNVPMTSTPISESFSTPNNERSKRKRQEDSEYSDPSSIDSFDSKLSESSILTGSSDDDERPRKKSRCIFTSVQVTELEKCYNTNKFLPIEKRPLLSKRLGLSEQQVKTWFQNRRMKDKRQQKPYEKMLYHQGTVDFAVAMGLPNHRIDTIGCQPTYVTRQLNQQQLQQSPPTNSQMSFMFGYSPVSPILYPGYSHHFYNGLSLQPSP